VGNKIAPRFADWYLARTGFKSQQIEDMPVERPAGNLFDPVPEGSTHGIFDAQARTRSYQLWATTHRPLLAAAAAGLAGAVAGVTRVVRG